MEKVRIVIVGLHFGAAIVRQLMELEARGASPMEIVGICDLDPARFDVVERDTHRTFRRYASLDEVLGDPAVEAVGLYIGPNGRAKVLRKILAAGKDVMTTKPFETNPEEAAAVLAEVRRLGRVIHANSPSPGLPDDLATIRRWREGHALGRPISAYCESYASYREVADGSWYDDPALCPVAPVLRLGIYLLNDLVWLFGRAASVSVQESRIFTKRPTPDNAMLSIRFENGALATVFASFCVRDGNPWQNQLVAHFENGTVYRNMATVRREDGGAELSLVCAKPGEEFPCAHYGEIAETAVARTLTGTYDWEGFARAVRREPGAPAYESDDLVVEPIRILRAMAEAERSGGTVVMSNGEHISPYPIEGPLGNQ